MLLVMTGCATFHDRQIAQDCWRQHSHESLMACTDDFIFREEFRGILDNLISQYWEPDGNWKGDIQGDATY
ncbi:MAG: hypothetical protein JXM72_11735, partial [Deltaproteobacteria bacterium]|nr:hypothetical protein [Deltaproteobacteria bacterium]